MKWSQNTHITNNHGNNASRKITPDEDSVEGRSLVFASGYVGRNGMILGPLPIESWGCPVDNSPLCIYSCRAHSTFPASHVWLPEAIPKIELVESTCRWSTSLLVFTCLVKSKILLAALWESSTVCSANIYRWFSQKGFSANSVSLPEDRSRILPQPFYLSLWKSQVKHPYFWVKSHGNHHVL